METKKDLPMGQAKMYRCLNDEDYSGFKKGSIYSEQTIGFDSPVSELVHLWPEDWELVEPPESVKAETSEQVFTYNDMSALYTWCCYQKNTNSIQEFYNYMQTHFPPTKS